MEGRLWFSPTRANEQITVRYDLINRENARFHLLDIYGRTVSESLLTGNKGDVLVPVTGLPSGIYFVALDGVASGNVLSSTTNLLTLQLHIVNCFNSVQLIY